MKKQLAFSSRICEELARLVHVESPGLATPASAGKVLCPITISFWPRASMSFRFELRSKREIKKMRAAGLVVWEAHQSAAKMIGPGVSTAEINQVYICLLYTSDAADE